MLLGPYNSALNKPIAPFLHDRIDQMGVIASSMYRWGVHMPTLNVRKEEYLLAYAKSLIQMMIPQTSLHDEVKSLDKWLDEGSYPGHRREVLRKLGNDLIHYTTKMLGTKGAIKAQFEKKPSIPRAINPFSDDVLSAVGPIFNFIDEVTFRSPFFGLKHTHPSELPEKLSKLFGSDPVLCTDFTSFEAHHRDVYTKIAIFWAMHILRGLKKNHSSVLALIRRLMTGTNTVKLQGVTMRSVNRLMSGASWTSSLNGLVNLIVISLMSMQQKYPNLLPHELAAKTMSEFKGVFEGDDGMCYDYNIPDDVPATYGLRLKWEHHNHFSDGGFCQIYCDEMSGKIAKDPLPVLQKLFWTAQKDLAKRTITKRALLRARAMSLLANYGSAPVIASACHYIMRRTKGVDVRHMRAELDMWDQRAFDKAMTCVSWREVEPIPLSLRCTVERQFGLSVSLQEDIESAFNNADTDFFDCDLFPLYDNTTQTHSEEFVHNRDEPWGEPPRNHIPADVIDAYMYGLDGTLDVANRTPWSLRASRADRAFAGGAFVA